MSSLGLGFFICLALDFGLGGFQDPFHRRHSGQWDEGSGRRGAVGQWRWEEGRIIWRSMYCLFISLFADGKFATFGPPVIERNSRMGGRLFLQVVCGGEKGGGTGLVKG